MLLALLSLLAPSQEPAQEPAFDLEHTRAVLSAEIETLIESGVASVSIALVREGEIVWTAAFGHANVWARTPATPETIYCTGSTFKAVTATAILQLVERGELALDDPVNRYLGEDGVTELEDQPVTVRHVLSHASGLNAGASTVPLWQRALPTPLPELTAGLRAVDPPEARYVYNNHAYGLAGLLVERVSGQSFEDYLVEHVLRPLGVTTPGPVHPTPVMVERMALPYRPGPDGPIPLAQVRYDVFPAGDIWLTAEDMARFLAAHLEGGVFREQRILTAESVAEAHRPQFFDYGLGWGVSKQRPHLLSHGGGVPGFITFMIGDTEARVGAYVMSNSADMTSVGQAALKLLRGEEYVPRASRPTVVLSEEVLEPYVGTYTLAPGFELAITREGQQLHLQATGQQRLNLHAAAEAHFFLREIDVEVRFLADEEGVIDRLVLTQNGAPHEARRKD